MNKRFFITWVVVFLAWMAGDFVVQPMSVALVIQQAVFASDLLLILGAVVAFMYRAHERIAS